MKGTPKLYIFRKLNLYICLDVDTITKAKIPQKMNKISRILVCDIRRIDLIKIETTQSVFKIFA